MRWINSGLIILMMASTPSCGALLDAIRGPLITEETRRSALCNDTRGAREAHVRSLLALGRDRDEERTARRTGAVAMGAVAAGCGEIDPQEVAPVVALGGSG